MDCFSFISVIIIIIIIINLYCQNDEYLNISLIVILVLCFIVKVFKCNCKKKENLENNENETETKTENDENESETKTETGESEQKQETETPTVSDKYKYYDPDIEFMNSLFNNDKIIIDNLNIGHIESSYLKNLIYPVGSVVISDKKIEELNLPGKWKKIEGGRLIATSGNITITRTVSSSTQNYPLKPGDAAYANNNYDVIKYNVNKKSLTMGHNQTSKEANGGTEIAEETVKLYGNNIMNHNHPIWTDWKKTARDKDSNKGAFALVGGSDDDSKKCQDKDQQGSCHNELFPSYGTWIYNDKNQKIAVTDKTYIAHNNIPKYILVYAYIRTE